MEDLDCRLGQSLQFNSGLRNKKSYSKMFHMASSTRTPFYQLGTYCDYDYGTVLHTLRKKIYCHMKARNSSRDMRIDIQFIMGEKCSCCLPQVDIQVIQSCHN